MTHHTNLAIGICGVMNIILAGLAVDIDVSPGGDDANPDTRERPLATLYKAPECGRRFCGNMPETRKELYR